MADSVAYVTCPGCERAVRELNDAPCPNCRRCLFCGRKIKPDETRCGCPLSSDPNQIAQTQWALGIAEDQVPRERRRFEIREQLESRKNWASGVLGGIFSITAAGGMFLEKLNVVEKIAIPVVGGIIFVLIVFLLEWVFRRIEDHRLNSEFPWNSVEQID